MVQDTVTDSKLWGSLTCGESFVEVQGDLGFVVLTKGRYTFTMATMRIGEGLDVPTLDLSTVQDMYGVYRTLQPVLEVGRSVDIGLTKQIVQGLGKMNLEELTAEEFLVALERATGATVDRGIMDESRRGEELKDLEAWEVFKMVSGVCDNHVWG